MKIWTTFSAEAAGLSLDEENPTQHYSSRSTGNMKRASYAKVCGWISEACTSGTNECVKNGFRKALYETGKKEVGDAEDEREGNDEDESVETDAPGMLVEIIESFEIHSDDDFEG
ncbi:hypothetical protein HZS_1541, partial [Henneguya salminicola]